MTRNKVVLEYLKCARKIRLAVFRISDETASGTRMGRPVSVRFSLIRIAGFFRRPVSEIGEKKSFFRIRDVRYGYRTSSTGTGLFSGSGSNICT